MTTPKLLGKNLIVEWTKTGGSTLSIATKSRNFKYSAKANSIDTSVREDKLAGTNDKTPDAPDRTAQLSGLDTDENAPDWETVEVGDEGVLTWYRRGKATGKPFKTAAAKVTSVDFNSPHDNANDWSIDWEITETPTPGTVS